MGKKKQSHTQEGLLIAFVTVCFALVVATLVIAFGDATAGGSTKDYFGGGALESTLSPSLIPPTTRPHDSGHGERSGNHEGDQANIVRQATLAARFDAEQQGLAY
jgi:hypothetical protein